MMSESDYPFDVICFEQTTEVTRDFLRRVIKQPDAFVAQESVDDFFRAAVTEHEGQTKEARQALERFLKLVETLKRNLADVRVYKVGEVNIAVYIVGRAPSGRWLGLLTRVVET